MPATECYKAGLRRGLVYLIFLPIFAGCLSEEKSDIDEIAEEPQPPVSSDQFVVVSYRPTETQLADVSSTVQVTFNSDVDASSVNNTSITINDQQGLVAGTINVSGTTVTFTPLNAMDIGMVHSVEVSSGIVGVNGEGLESTLNWSFSTSHGDAVPEISALEAAIFESGPTWGEFMDPNGGNTLADQFYHQFYDTANSFEQISVYLGEAEPWQTYATWSRQVYREYLLSTGYVTQGWRRTTHGFYEDIMRGGDVTLQELEMLRDNPAYSRVSESQTQGGAEHRSRPLALALQANIHAERAGSPRMVENGEERLVSFIPWMGSHLYEWRTGDYRGTYRNGEIARFAPFMFGLTSHALIEFIEWERENGRDPNAYWRTTYPMDYGQGTTAGAATVTWPTIVDALADVAEWAVLESHVASDPNVKLWLPDSNGYASFAYDTKKTTAEPATGLNLMIAHAYAWLWKETGDRRYRDWGDQLFGAGALNSRSAARLDGKHFNQHFRMSFDFLKWRAEGDALWGNQ
jgi:hypothetical protein